MPIKVKLRSSYCEYKGFKFLVYANGEVWKYSNWQKKWYKLNLKPTNSGYIKVHLVCDKQESIVNVHRLVYYAFNKDFDIDNPKIFVDHKDGNKRNNRISNLRLATCSENCQNRKKSNKSRTGVKNIFPHYDRQQDNWYWRICLIAKGKRYQKRVKAGNGRPPDNLPPVPEHIIEYRNKMLIQHHGEFAKMYTN